MVSFKNAIIILTSNLGSAEIFNAAYKQKKEGGQVAGEALDTANAGQHISRDNRRVGLHKPYVQCSQQRWHCSLRLLRITA